MSQRFEPGTPVVYRLKEGGKQHKARFIGPDPVEPETLCVVKRGPVVSTLFWDNVLPASLVQDTTEAPALGPLARYLEARNADPTIRRTEENLRQVFAPTAPAKKETSHA